MKLCEVSARNIINLMGIKKGSLKNAMRALKYFPWTIIASWEIIDLTDKGVLSVEKCPPQLVRTKNNKKLFVCNVY